MIDINSSAKYKYLVLFVHKSVHEYNDIYQYEYTVTGIDNYESTSVLGYYDSEMKQPVLLLSNNDILDFDWTTVPSRIRSGNCKEYMDLFMDDKNIIVVSEGLENKCCQKYKNYTIQFTDIETYRLAKNENLTNYVATNVISKDKEKMLDEKLKETLSTIPPENRPKIIFNTLKETVKRKMPSELTCLVIVALFVISLLMIVGIITVTKIIKEYDSAKISRAATFIESKTYNPYMTAYNNAKAADSTSDINIMQRTDSAYLANLEKRADSVAREAIRNDSIVYELAKTKSVQIELSAIIEDGITVRKVQTNVIVESIEESDMRNLTNTITKMATNMAKDRQTEIDTTKSYYSFGNLEDNTVIIQ